MITQLILMETEYQTVRILITLSQMMGLVSRTETTKAVRIMVKCGDQMMEPVTMELVLKTEPATAVVMAQEIVTAQDKKEAEESN